MPDKVPDFKGIRVCNVQVSLFMSLEINSIQLFAHIQKFGYVI